MGICAGAGYTANAAINDRRFKAVSTVSAVKIGSMFRNGRDNDVKSIDALPLLQAGSDARTSDATGAKIVTIPLAPLKKKTRRTRSCAKLGNNTIRPAPNARPLQALRRRAA